MKYKNITDYHKSLAIPLPDGSVHWFDAEPNGIIDIPAEEDIRARERGFVPVEEKVISKPVEQPKKKENEVIKALSKVKGLGYKTIQEIAEEYDSLAQIKADIRAKKFNVGGVDKAKEKIILGL